MYLFSGRDSRSGTEEENSGSSGEKTSLDEEEEDTTSEPMEDLEARVEATVGKTGMEQINYID